MTIPVIGHIVLFVILYNVFFRLFRDKYIIAKYDHNAMFYGVVFALIIEAFISLWYYGLINFSWL